MTEYETNEKLDKDIKAVLDKKIHVEFNPIREQELKILSLIVTKTNKDGEEEPLKRAVVCKKLPPDMKALTKGHYVIRMCHYFWTHANEIEKDALIHHALMTILVEKSAKTGKIVLKTRPPDVVEFRATVYRYGAYNETLIDFREAFKMASKQLVESHKATS